MRSQFQIRRRDVNYRWKRTIGSLILKFQHTPSQWIGWGDDPASVVRIERAVWLQSAAVPRRDASFRRRDAASLVAVGPCSARCCGRESWRQTPLRRPTLQLQQAGETRGQHVGRLESLHQTKTFATYRRGEIFWHADSSSSLFCCKRIIHYPARPRRL